MDAAPPRSAMPDRPPTGNLPPDRWRTLLITGVGAALVDTVLWLISRNTFAGLPSAYWVMAALAVTVDARPYVVANRRASSVILPSICFTFGIALAWGLIPALAVQVAAVTVAGARMRQLARRTLNLGVKHVGALTGADVVAALVGLRLGPAPPWDDALLTIAAAAAWVVARYGLAAAI